MNFFLIGAKTEFQHLQTKDSFCFTSIAVALFSFCDSCLNVILTKKYLTKPPLGCPGLLQLTHTF